MRQDDIEQQVYQQQEIDDRLKQESLPVFYSYGIHAFASHYISRFSAPFS